MKATPEDAQPRRDGWFEHAGTWGEVTLGTIVADTQSRTKRWEIVDVAMATPVPFASTLWMRAREATSGEEFTVVPRTKTTAVTILTRSPADTATAPPSPPSDVEAIMLVIEKLGARLLASRDEYTGEITCPDYLYDSHLAGDRNYHRGLIEHMEIAHGMAVDHDIGFEDAITLHGNAHDQRHPGVGKRGGFPHRHVPEDLTILTGIK